MTDAASIPEGAPARPAGPFRAGVVLALVLVGVFALLALGALSAYAPDLDRGNDGSDHALSRSSIGYAAVVDLLRGMERPVILSRDPSQVEEDGLLILTPSAQRENDEAIESLRRRSNSVLIVLPKWDAAPDLRHQGWVREAGVMAPRAALSVLPEDVRRDLVLSEDALSSAAAPRLLGAGGEVLAVGGPVRGLRTLSGPGWTPVVTDGQGRGVLVTHEATGLYVLADADLLNTKGMDDPAKARAALALLESVAPPNRAVAFDLSLHGFGRPRSVLRLLLEPPLLGFTLCLLAAAALVGWQAAIRFQPHRQARRAVALGKKALADNTAALVRLARREHRMAPPYAELVRAQAAKAVSAPPGLSRDATTHLLDRLAKTAGSETTYADLSAQAEAARNPGDLMSVARSLMRWKLEMTRGRD